VTCLDLPSSNTPSIRPAIEASPCSHPEHIEIERITTTVRNNSDWSGNIRSNPAKATKIHEAIGRQNQVPANALSLSATLQDLHPLDAEVEDIVPGLLISPPYVAA